jgi:hypothetical protein
MVEIHLDKARSVQFEWILSKAKEMSLKALKNELQIINILTSNKINKIAKATPDSIPSLTSFKKVS